MRARGAQDGSPAPPARGPWAVQGRASVTGADPRPRTPAGGPRGPWAAAGLNAVPARGEGALQAGSPFCSSKPGGSDCSKWGGGAEEPRFPRLPSPFSLVGRGRGGGTPVLPRPHPAGSGSQSSPPVGGEALRPRPELIGGSWRQPRSRTRRRTSCRLALSPAAAVHAPSAARVGPRATLAPRPTSPLGRCGEWGAWRVP